MVHDGEGDILRRPWKSPGVLEELEEHGKIQPRGPMLVLDQRPFFRENRPMFD